MFKKIISRLNVSFYLSCVAIILSIVALSIYVVNSDLPYFSNLNVSVIVLTILSILSMISTLVVSQIFGDKWFLGVLELVSCVLLTIAATTAIVDRSTAMGFVWFSNLEADNIEAVSALNHALGFMITYICGIVLIIVGSFFKYVHLPKQEQSKVSQEA